MKKCCSLRKPLRVWIRRALLGFGALAVSSGTVQAQEWAGANETFSPASVASLGEDCCEEEEAKGNYGPCDCEPRMTLFQWSYGTSFEGGASLDEPLIGDRPDFTEASTTVGRGVNQLEMGYTYTYDEEAGTSVRSNSAPELLWRAGILAEWLEFRAAWNYSNERTNNSGAISSASGNDDIYLGFKIALTPQEGWLPEMALLPQMTVPVGGDFSTEEVMPGLNWVYSWAINDCYSFGGSTQANRAQDDTTGDAYTEFAQSLVVGYSVTERVGAYAEWYALFPHSSDTALPEHYIDGGFTYSVTNNLQLDVRAGLGLNDAADDYFLGTGAVVRF